MEAVNRISIHYHNSRSDECLQVCLHGVMKVYVKEEAIQIVELKSIDLLDI